MEDPNAPMWYNGIYHLFYQYNPKGSVWGDIELVQEWVKLDNNPIIAPVQGMNATAFRDPTTTWLGPDKRWRLVMGSLRKHRGLAVMYRIKDFIYWVKVKHPVHSVADNEYCILVMKFVLYRRILVDNVLFLII